MRPMFVAALATTASVASLVLAASPFVASCGGDAFQLATPDAAVGGDSGGALPPTPEAAAPEAAVDGAGDPTSAFCSALTTFTTRCEADAACAQTNLKNCGALSFALSQVTRDALIHCEPNLACVGGSDFIRQSCVSGALAAAVLTAAQAKLAADYCAACPPAASAPCSAATFYKEGITSLGDGPGLAALLYNDVLVRSVDTQCIPVPGDAGSCDLRFRVCEAFVLTPQVPADACRDGGL